jgi:hypothetical protein
MTTGGGRERNADESSQFVSSLHLVTQSGVPDLLLIGAYRDNQVSASHPVVSSWQRSGGGRGVV